MVDFHEARMVSCVSELGPGQALVALTTFNQSLAALILVMIAQNLRAIEQNMTIVTKSTFRTFLEIMIAKLQDVHALRFYRFSSSQDPATLWV